jgi:predicted PurR-regulated permease PerM
MRRTTDTAKSSRYLLLVSVCIVVAALYLASEVLIPLALAILLSFLMAPLVHRLERFNLGRVPSVLIVVIALFAGIGILGYVVASQLYDLANNIDQYRDNITAKVERVKLRGGLLEKIQRTAAEVEQRIQKNENPATTQSTQPSDRAAELVATEAAARARDPRAMIEPPATNPAAAR